MPLTKILKGLALSIAITALVMFAGMNAVRGDTFKCSTSVVEIKHNIKTHYGLEPIFILEGRKAAKFISEGPRSVKDVPVKYVLFWDHAFVEAALFLAVIDKNGCMQAAGSIGETHAKSYGIKKIQYAPNAKKISI